MSSFTKRYHRVTREVRELAEEAAGEGRVEFATLEQAAVSMERLARLKRAAGHRGVMIDDDPRMDMLEPPLGDRLEAGARMLSGQGVLDDEEPAEEPAYEPDYAGDLDKKLADAAKGGEPC